MSDKAEIRIEGWVVWPLRQCPYHYTKFREVKKMVELMNTIFGPGHDVRPATIIVHPPRRKRDAKS